jgi:septum formation protein
MSPGIILASASEVRRRLLASAGLIVGSMASGVDESKLKADFFANGRQDVSLLATTLAGAKAERVSADHAQALVIGADQLLICEDRVFDKPDSLKEAKHQLLQLRGKTHRLLSAVAVARKGHVIWHTSDAAELSMRNFSDEFLLDYLAAAGSDALTSVGAYKIEARGVQLFERIDGDYFAILGLPLLPLLAFLRDEGCLPS